jgi:hypothetical protein
MSTKAFQTILKAWLIAGTLDILSAIIQTYVRSGKTPGFILKYIASGVFGKQAMTGGTGMILAGIFFHYFIAFAFTVLFFLAYPKIKLLQKNVVVVGIVYGLLCWCIMNLVVVPLSNAPVPHPTPFIRILGILYLIFLIGLPIALITKKHYTLQSTHS